MRLVDLRDPDERLTGSHPKVANGPDRVLYMGRRLTCDLSAAAEGGGMMTAIDDKARELAWIGQPKDEGGGSGEMVMPDGRGRARDYDNGTIYWTPETGAHEIHGDIRLHHVGKQALLGYPTTDETGCPDGVGRFNHFEFGSIYWTPSNKAWEVHGAIRDLWAKHGWERGPMGYPVSDEHDISGGRESRFQHGRITWTPQGGAVEHREVQID
jgi:uncharacterized protein with LGFP repeats